MCEKGSLEFVLFTGISQHSMTLIQLRQTNASDEMLCEFSLAVCSQMFEDTIITRNSM